VAADAVASGRRSSPDDLREPLGALRDDEQRCKRLDVVDGGWLVVEADQRRERRLVARLRALAFERFEQRLLARLVGAGAAVHVDRSRNRPDVPAEEAARVGVRDRLLEHALHVQELTGYRCSDLRADRVAANRASLIDVDCAHQQVVLERARLTLVGVAGDVARLDLLVDELPLHPGREAGAPQPAAAPPP
jgi:hypothetical protein